MMLTTLPSFQVTIAVLASFFAVAKFRRGAFWRGAAGTAGASAPAASANERCISATHERTLRRGLLRLARGQCIRVHGAEVVDKPAGSRCGGRFHLGWARRTKATCAKGVSVGCSSARGWSSARTMRRTRGRPRA